VRVEVSDTHVICHTAILAEPAGESTISANPAIFYGFPVISNYSISGMHCQSCEGKVREAIRSVDGVTSAQVSLDTGNAIVESKVALTLETLHAAIAQVGDYQIVPVESAHSGEACELRPAQKSWLQTYKPLLTIAAFIVGGTLLIAVSTQNWHAMPLMNSFMGLFFVVFAFFKILDIPGFARAYQSYDVIAARWPTYGYIYPWIELGLGIAYLLQVWPMATNLITLFIMAIGTIGVVNAVLRKQQIQCGCLGTVFQLPMSTVTIVEDVLMVAMAAASLVMVA
jgi:copper chaperone CopZ